MKDQDQLKHEAEAMLVKGNPYDERDMRGRKNLGERIRSKFHSVVYGKIPEEET